MLQFSCPHCQAQVSARPEQAGQRFDCPHCQKRFKVPGVATAMTPSDDFFDWDDSPPAESTAKVSASSEPNSQAKSQPKPQPPAAPARDTNAVDATSGPSPLAATGDDADVLDASELLLAEDDLLAGDASAVAPSSTDSQSPEADPWDGEEGLSLDLDLEPQPASNTAADDDPFGLDLSQFERDAAPLGGPAVPTRPAPAAPLQPNAAVSNNPTPIADDLADELSGAKPVVENVQFGFSCPICEGRLVAYMSEVGKTIRCPDCHSDIEIKAPKKKPTRSIPKSEYASFNLANAAESSHYDPQLPKKLADDMLAKAEKELEADGEERDPSYYDDMPQIGAWIRDVGGFLIDARVIVRIVILGLVTWVLVSGTTAAWSFAEGNLAGMVALMGMFVLCVLIGLPATAFMSVSGIAVLEDTVNGQSRIESWPDLNVMDWIPDTLYIVSSFAIAGIPGWLAYLIAEWAGSPVTVPLFVIVFSEFLLFPFILLSELEAGSPWMPYSKVITASFNKHFEPWGAFMFPTGLLAFAAFLMLVVMDAFGPLMDAFCSFGLVTLAFLYFRLLGRLGAQIATIDVAAIRAKKSADLEEDAG